MFGEPNYFLLASGAFAGDEAAGAELVDAGAVEGEVAAGAVGVAGFIVFAGVAGFAVLLAGASPQAIPRAPIAKTDDSAITFFIRLILLSSLSLEFCPWSCEHEPCPSTF